MTVGKIIEGTKITLIPEGFIDTANSASFESAVDAIVSESKDIVIDFSKVEYISSSGLRILLKLQKAMMAADGSLVLKNVDKSVKEVFELTGFLDIFKVE